MQQDRREERMPLPYAFELAEEVGIFKTTKVKQVDT
jgi:hypothetical protein